MKPLVSIVVPIYNVENYVEKCLDSIKNQTLTDIEVLCVDDGSTDSSSKIVKDYCETDERYTYLYKENGGLSAARNFGLPLTNAEYVMFIDSDDFIEPDMVELMYNTAITDNSDIVVCDIYQYFHKRDIKEILHSSFDDKYTYSPKVNKELIGFVKNAAWNKLYRKKLFIENDITYPKGYRYEDMGTTPLLLVNSEKVSFVNKPLYNYLADRTNNITQTYDEKIYHIHDMLAHSIKYFRDNDLFDDYFEELKYLSIINITDSLRKIRYYSDKAFVMKYIDDSFLFIRNNFGSRKCKYNYVFTKNDKIYTSKFLLKLYYNYLRLKKKEVRG